MLDIPCCADDATKQPDGRCRTAAESAIVQAPLTERGEQLPTCLCTIHRFVVTPPELEIGQEKNKSFLILFTLEKDIRKGEPYGEHLFWAVLQNQFGKIKLFMRERDLLQVPHFFVGTLQPL